jgi:hypothetical protein
VLLLHAHHDVDGWRRIVGNVGAQLVEWNAPAHLAAHDAPGRAPGDGDKPRRKPVRLIDAIEMLEQRREHALEDVHERFARRFVAAGAGLHQRRVGLFHVRR